MNVLSFEHNNALNLEKKKMPMLHKTPKYEKVWPSIEKVKQVMHNLRDLRTACCCQKSALNNLVMI